MILGVAGYLGAFLTAIYTFRMIFRAFLGEMCRRPRSSRTGTSTTRRSRRTRRPARSRTPTSASPGPEHHIAEREVPMKVAMGTLAVLAIVGGFLQIPGVTERAAPLPRADVRGLAALRDARAVRRRRSGSGSASARVDRPRRHRRRVADLRQGRQRRRRSRRASPGCTRFFVNKWYFDEAIDFLIVRPSAWSGASPTARSSACSSTARLVGGSTGAVRVLSAAGARHPVGLPALLRRAAAHRPQRPRRLLPDLGMTIHLSILVFFPLFRGVLCGVHPAAAPADRADRRGAAGATR